MLTLGSLGELVTQRAVDAVLFDWDGTLVHSQEAHIRAALHGYRKHGLAVERSWLADRGGLTTRQAVLARAREVGKTVDVDAIVDTVEAAYAREARSVLGDDAVIGLLRACSQFDVATAVVTGSRRSALESVARRLELLALFDAVITIDDVDRPKPHPNGYLMALRLLDLAAEDVAVVEDSTTGITAARAAGIQRVIDLRHREAAEVHLRYGV